mgnify:CR=1 FL=1
MKFANLTERLRHTFQLNKNRKHQSTSQVMKTYNSLNNWKKFQITLFWEGILVGVFSGLIISLFRYLLTEAEEWRIQAFAFLENNEPHYSFLWFAGLLVVAYVLYRISHHEPMASGSGIPQVKGVILGLMRMNWFRILWVKLSGGVIGLGAGLSLGREGPSIQIGAVAAQGISRFLGRTRMEERYLITSGASAGLATAFNAPLAGVIFALEELHRNFSAVVLLPAMAAALTATFISRILFGRATIFSFYGLQPLALDYHILFPILTAIIAGVAGVIFNKGLLNVGRFYKLSIFPNGYSKVAFALLVSGVLGFVLPQVLGGGNILVNELALQSFPSKLLVLLIVGKFLFTLVSYGCGVPGGFFLPMLVLGALTGSLCANGLIALGLILPEQLPNIIIIAMAAFFSASVRAPITGTVLIMEMTGSFDHMMVLAIASAIAYVIAEMLGGQPIYEALLVKQLENRTAPPENMVKDERDIIEVPVCSGSILENKRVRDIKWPHCCLLVDVKRGPDQLVPDGETVLRQGDYLYILTKTENAEEVKSMGEDIQAPHSTVYGDF